jgi:hypothetical protein
MEENTKIANDRFYIDNIYYIPVNKTLFPAGGVPLQCDMFQPICVVLRCGFYLQLLYILLSVNMHVSRVDLPVLYTTVT